MNDSTSQEQAEDAKPFHLICKLLFYYEEYFNSRKKIQIFGLKKSLKLKFAKYHICVQRMLSASTCDANHYVTINNEE